MSGSAYVAKLKQQLTSDELDAMEVVVSSVNCRYIIDVLMAMDAEGSDKSVPLFLDEITRMSPMEAQSFKDIMKESE